MSGGYWQIVTRKSANLGWQESFEETCEDEVATNERSGWVKLEIWTNSWENETYFCRESSLWLYGQKGKRYREMILDLYVHTSFIRIIYYLIFIYSVFTLLLPRPQ